MDSAPACVPARDEPSSSDAVSRDVGSSLPRKGRPFVALRPSAGFSVVYRRGTSGRAGGVRVVKAPGEPGLPQVGIVAARSVGNAVRRNRAKRRIREALMDTKLLPDTAYIVIASPSVPDVEFDRLKGWIAAAIRQAGETGIDEVR
jgi:ribonuclease P protein component